MAKRDAIRVWLRGDLLGPSPDHAVAPVTITATADGRTVRRRRSGDMLVLEELTRTGRVVRKLEVARVAVLAVVEEIAEAPPARPGRPRTAATGSRDSQAQQPQLLPLDGRG